MAKKEKNHIVNCCIKSFIYYNRPDGNMKHKYRVHRFSIKMTEGQSSLEQFLNGLEGEVVAIIHPETGRLIVHRIIGKKGEDYLIKGDNTPDADGLIAASNILGRVKKVERNNRNVFLGLGPERLLISFLTRWRFLPLLRPVWRFVHPAFRRLIT